MLGSPRQHAWRPAGRRARSTPLLPRAFPSDHATDDDFSQLVPLRPGEDRAVSNAWIAAGNYFVEWCAWVGHAVTALAFPLPFALIAAIPQLVILASIFGVTGIPPTEAQALRSKGDKYRAYQALVSKFVPWPPKPRAPGP